MQHLISNISNTTFFLFEGDCHWPDNPKNEHRRKFCARYEGYGKLCQCDVTQWDDVFFSMDKEVII